MMSDASFSRNRNLRHGTTNNCVYVVYNVLINLTGCTRLITTAFAPSVMRLDGFGAPLRAKPGVYGGVEDSVSPPLARARVGQRCDLDSHKLIVLHENY